LQGLERGVTTYDAWAAEEEPAGAAAKVMTMIMIMVMMVTIIMTITGQVHSAFVSAATRGAIAVIDGNVMAINPDEEAKMQMFIWNNIFFSLGFDVKDHYKDLGGDAAAYVAPRNDLRGVKVYNAVDLEGLFTLGTEVLDYRGYKVTAQSIIPGILEREQE
jgi:protein TIF31